MSIFLDTFVRANQNPPGNGWTVQNDAAASSSWSVTSDHLNKDSGSGSYQYCYNAASIGTLADYIVKATYLSTTDWATASRGVCARYTDNSNHYLWFLISPTSIRLYKRVAGTYTGLGAGAVTISTLAGASHVLSIQVQGNTITGYVDGAQIQQVTDSAITTAGNIAVMSNDSAANSEQISQVEVDALPATSLTPSTVAISSTGNTITVTGTNTAWVNGTTVFSASAGTITAQTVNSATSATLTFTAPASLGALTISNNTDSSTATIQVVTILVTDANAYWSPYNWFSDGAGALSANNVHAGSSSVRTTNAGAYLRMGFTGTSVAVAVDVSALVAAGAGSTSYPTLAWSIDGGAWSTTTLTSASAAVSLATGLAAGTHQMLLVLLYFGNPGGVDRWNVPSQVLKIWGINLDAAATSAAARIRPKNILVYGDSITEGLHADPATSGANNAVATYAWHLGEALNAEVGIVGYNTQKFSGSGGATGNIVPLYGTGAPNQSWNLYDANDSRLVSGSLSPPPDYIVTTMGTNDGLASVPAATVTTSINGWFAAERAAAPNAWIFACVPFGQFEATAFANATPPDSKCKIINLDTLAGSGELPSLGLTDAGGASRKSTDTIHPNAEAHAEMASRLAEVIGVNITSASGSTGSPAPINLGGLAGVAL